MRVDDLRSLSPLRRALTDEQLVGAGRGRRRGAASSPASTCSTRASPPTSGGCSSTGRSTSCAASAARTPWSAGWTCRVAGPAGSGPGTSTASTWRPATGCTRRAGAPRARRGAAGPRQRLVPVRRAPHRGPLPHRAHHRVDGAAARRRWSPSARSRPVSPTRSTTRRPPPRGRSRPRGRLRDAAVVARGGWRSGEISAAAVQPRSTRCAARSSPCTVARGPAGRGRPRGRPRRRGSPPRRRA